MSQIKVFVEGHVFDGEFQGTYTYLLECYKVLVRNYPDIVFVFGCQFPDKIKDVFGDYENVIFVKYRSGGTLTRLFFEIPWIIREYNITHAHFQYLLPFLRSRNCLYFTTIHDILFNDYPQYFPYFYRLIRRFLFGVSARKADLIFTVSNYSKKRISDFYKLTSEKIIITPNAVSDSFVNFSYDKEYSRKYLYRKYGVKSFYLYVSRVEPRKNQDRLLSWFQSYSRRSDDALVFIGKNTLGVDWDPGQYKRIFWFEQVSFDDLLHFYNAAKVFIYLSTAEGFGIPPLEAAVMRTPVISTNCTAMSDFDFFEPYMLGNDFSDSELSNKVSDIQEMGECEISAIKYEVLSRYSWTVSADKIAEQFYRLSSPYVI